MRAEDAGPCVRPLTCPVCHSPLNQVERTLQCAQNHAFDIAREGYVNLMLGHRRPRLLGDDKAMLQARRRFLGNGRYDPLAQSVNQIVLAHLSERAGAETAVLDIGCGEGYYLGQMLPNLPDGVCAFGLDAAKEAARLAAKRYPAARFVVADVNGRLPFADQSIHALLNIFAPRHPAEFARIAAPGALLLIAIPQPGHLRALRERFELLAVEPEKRRRVIERMNGRFTLQHSRHLTIELDLSQPDLIDLVQMTPNHRHLTPAKQAQLQAMPRLQTTAQFELLAFGRGRD